MIEQIIIFFDNNLNTFEIYVEYKQNVRKGIKYDQISQHKSVKVFLWLERNPVWLSHHHVIASRDYQLIEHFLIILINVFQSSLASYINCIYNVKYQNECKYCWSHFLICKKRKTYRKHSSSPEYKEIYSWWVPFQIDSFKQSSVSTFKSFSL